ncbi:MAG: Long-chain-fatty-acid--CoA ligase [Syntrophorhabdaceae bacterium PtaU1.Bin034]|nr:MAG: Long-chain-fatty-acid--CoA ligase [Syntrophorhabdaceae bacterium PtaU1.Bin034]
MNVAKNLELSAFFFPSRPVVRQDGFELTYGQVNDQANRIATGLIGMGLKPGELVAICAPNSADWIIFYFGILKAGGVAVTLSAALTGEELKNLVRHARPRFVFTAESKLREMEQVKAQGGVEKIICPGGDLDAAVLISKGTGSFEAIDRDRTDTAAILYTGGTTGVPKGVMLKHEGINFSSQAIAFYERSTERDIALCFLPFNHVFGQIHIMNSTIFSSGCLEMLPSFDMDRVLSILAAGRITKFFAVPTVYIRFLALPDLAERLGALRYCFSAGASMALEIVKQWKERTGITISESYGMTECMPVTFNHYYPEMHLAGSVGQPCPGVEVQIRDIEGNVLDQGKEGEICVKSPACMTGYLNNPEGTREAFWPNGWVRSGDIGVFDANDYLFIVDRLKDLIITGGENVFPREVEEALYAFPAVEECAVLGLPDKEWGERVAAFVVPKGGRPIETDSLKSFLKSRLSSFKVPKEYVIVKEMPKSAAGKILKRDLKKSFLESGNK